MELVLQNGLHTGQRSIATALAQSVYGDVQTLRSTEHSSQRVRYGQVVVVMGVEVEVHLWIALLHLAEILNHLQRIHHTQRIGQHETLDTLNFDI